MNQHPRVSRAKSSFRLDLHEAFIRRTDLSRSNLEEADIRGADASYAIFRGANFRNAKLDGTILRGADLTDAQNLTLEQLRSAVIDDETILPDYIDRAAL
jgi:uncharacterized protein YjbI with pentapeptide repeats